MKLDIEISLIDGKEYFHFKKDGIGYAGTYSFENALRYFLDFHDKMLFRKVASQTAPKEKSNG